MSRRSSFAGRAIVGPDARLDALELAAKMEGVWHAGFSRYSVGDGYGVIERVSVTMKCRTDFYELAQLAEKIGGLKVEDY